LNCTEDATDVSLKKSTSSDDYTRTTKKLITTAELSRNGPPGRPLLRARTIYYDGFLVDARSSPLLRSVRTSWRTRFSSASGRHGDRGALLHQKPTRNHVPWATDCGNDINRTVDTCVHIIVGGRREQQMMDDNRRYSRYSRDIIKMLGHGISGGPTDCAYGTMGTQCPVVHGDEFITRLFQNTVTAGHTRKTETHGQRRAQRGETTLTLRFLLEDTQLRTNVNQFAGRRSLVGSWLAIIR